jgi:hypothetical protein
MMQPMRRRHHGVKGPPFFNFIGPYFILLLSCLVLSFFFFSYLVTKLPSMPNRFEPCNFYLFFTWVLLATLEATWPKGTEKKAQGIFI